MGGSRTDEMTDLTDVRNRMQLTRMWGPLGGAVTWQPYSSSPEENDNARQFPNEATRLRDVLQGHLGVIDALQRSLANSTDYGLSENLRAHLATTAADAQAVRERLQAATTPRGVTLNSLPMTGPPMVTHPGSGGFLNEEEALQRQREGFPPVGE